MEEIISRPTRTAFGILIDQTREFGGWSITDSMRRSGLSLALIPSEQGSALEARFRGIDWRVPDSVNRIIPFVEEAYRRAAALPKLSRLKLEIRLRRVMQEDGLSFDEHGRIVPCH